MAMACCRAIDSIPILRYKFCNVLQKFQIAELLLTQENSMTAALLVYIRTREGHERCTTSCVTSLMFNFSAGSYDLG